MGMYSAKSYKLTKAEHDYLLPVLRSKLSSWNDDYRFCGDSDDLEDMLSRLKGLYGYFDSYNPIIDYKYFRDGSLVHFRNEMGVLA